MERYMLIFNFSFFFFLILFGKNLYAQNVTISEEINIRNDYSYDLLGKINESIVVFRDSGTEKVINVFKQDLSYKYERSLSLEKKKVLFHGVVPFDTCFHILYTYQSDSIITMMRKYNDQGIAIDTTPLFYVPKKEGGTKYRMITNENKSLTLLYYLDKKNGIFLKIIDHEKSALVYDEVLDVENVDLYKDYKNITFTNEGKIFFLFEKNTKKINNKDHHFVILDLDTKTDTYDNIVLPFNDLYAIDLTSIYDEKNNTYLLAGLYNTKSNAHSRGIFYYRVNDYLLEDDAIQLSEFDKAFYKDIYGNKKKNPDKLEYHKLKDIIHTEDGGFVVFTEFNKVYSRRAPFQSYRGDPSLGGIGRYMDFYMEEVSLHALSPDGKSRWNTILHKKQFSQDDNGVFSSFFLFTSPSRLKIIFNDEIKRDNIVSEYVLSPSGKLKRKSLMSTKYQELKLRFRDAMQLSNQEFIVPSERNSNLKLVKVSYL